MDFDVRNVIRKLPKNKRNNHFFRQKFLQNMNLELLQTGQKCYQKVFKGHMLTRDLNVDWHWSPGVRLFWTVDPRWLGAASLLGASAMGTGEVYRAFAGSCRRRHPGAALSSSLSSSSAGGNDKIGTEKESKF